MVVRYCPFGREGLQRKVHTTPRQQCAWRGQTRKRLYTYRPKVCRLPLSVKPFCNLECFDSYTL